MSLPAGRGPFGGLRGQYAETQKDFIKNQGRISAALKKHWQDPEYRARMNAVLNKRWQDPEYRARMSAASRKRWQDPEYRARMSAARKKQRQDRMKA